MTNQSNKYTTRIQIAGIVNTVRVIGYSIPKSQYLINDKNNTMMIDGQQLIISKSNYSINQLCQYVTTMQNKLNFSYDHQNQDAKIKIRNATQSDVIVQFGTLSSIFVTANDQLIISQDQQYTIPAQQILTVGPINLQLEDNYIMKSNIVSQQQNTVFGDLQSNDILHVIVDSKNVQPFNYMTSSTPGSHHRIQKEIKQQEYDLQIWIVDEDNNYIDFNNINFSVYIELSYQYSIQQLITMIKQDVIQPLYTNN